MASQVDEATIREWQEGLDETASPGEVAAGLRVLGVALVEAGLDQGDGLEVIFVEATRIGVRWAISEAEWNVSRHRGDPCRTGLISRDHARVAHHAWATRVPADASRWKHSKGGEYEVFAWGLDPDTLEPIIGYRAVATGDRWARPLIDFLGAVAVDGTVVRRFTPIPVATPDASDVIDREDEDVW